jgi:hypothetical protein
MHKRKTFLYSGQMFAVVHSSGSWYLEIVEIDVGLLVLVHEIVLSGFLG